MMDSIWPLQEVTEGLGTWAALGRCVAFFNALWCRPGVRVSPPFCCSGAWSKATSAERGW